MCGIAGFSGMHGRDALQAMIRALAHRGPDDQGLFFDGPAQVGLAQARLSIIDLSNAGHQPMTDASGRFTVVFNGEIYNYRELRDELLGEGAVFRGHSDTEVLLEWYARIGVALLPRLNGIFALAIWDRDRQEVLLARDALGVKPLYYTEGPRGVAFASELKALLPVLPHRSLDAVSLHRYLSFLWCPGEGTPLNEARQMLPGQSMWLRGGRIVERATWYELPQRRTPLPMLSEGEVVPATVAALRKAVHRQLVADVPIGAFLSGGLDSSAIVALAREKAPDLRCFSIQLTGGNDTGFVEDLPYARRVAQHLEVPLEVVSVDASRMAQDLERMIWMLDEPLADPAPLNVLYISELARSMGCKVLLSGAGGDDLFTGYRRHLALRYESCWSWLPLVTRRMLAMGTRRLSANSAMGRRLKRLWAEADADAEHRLAGYFRWLPEERLRSLYSRDFAAQLGVQRADQPMLDFLAGVHPTVSPIERMLALEQRFFLADHNLAYTDRMSMAAGVEVRVPFLDADLVELAARIPDRFKQSGRVGKWALKKAMEGTLPRDVIYRPKTGFGAPLRRWLQHDLRHMVDELLSQSSLQRRGLFDIAAVQQLRNDHNSGRVDAAYTLLSLMGIEIWCRQFIDR